MDEGTRLCEVGLPKDLERVATRLRTVYGLDLTVLAVLHLSKDAFAAHKGVGQAYVSGLEALQAQLPMMSDSAVAEDERVAVPAERLSDAERHLLDEYRLNVVDLPPDEIKVLRKLTGDDLSVGRILPPHAVMDLDAAALMADVRGFGQVSLDALHCLQRKIRGALVNFARFSCSCYRDSVLIPLEFGKGFPFEVLCFLIMEDLEKFALTLDDEDLYIWSRRFGFVNQQQTLEDIGAVLGNTRERVRQREKRMEGEMLASMRISPSVSAAAMTCMGPIEFWGSAEALRSRFPDGGKTALRALGILSGLGRAALEHRFWPAIKRSSLNQFFVTTPYPAMTADAELALATQFECSVEFARFYIKRMASEGYVRFQGESIIPQHTTRPVGVAHVLAGMPDGGSWQEIALAVNSAGILKADLHLDRPEVVLGTSPDIYLCDRGSYRHVRFLDLTSDVVAGALTSLRKFLIDQALESVCLQADYYRSELPDLDYYELRHIVRTYGEEAGVYFDGTSQADSVSLTKEAEPTTQREAVLRYVQSSGAAAVREVAEILRSGSEGHAKLYLRELRDSGKLVKLEDRRYGPAEVGRGVAKSGVDSPH
jgi:hypothetical protein